MNYLENKDYQKSQKLKIPKSKIKQSTKKMFKELREKQNLSSKDVTYFANKLATDLGIKNPPIDYSGVERCKVRNGKIVNRIFGTYRPSNDQIKIYKYTAAKKQVRATKSVLDTLLHELVHYIDYNYFKLGASPHTFGFHKRVNDLKEILLN